MFSILQICDGAVGSLGEVWGQYAACRVAGLPAECGTEDLRASIKGAMLQVEDVGPADSDGRRTVNLKLPDEVATGYNPLRIEYAHASAEMEVRVLWQAPGGRGIIPAALFELLVAGSATSSFRESSWSPNRRVQTVWRPFGVQILSR